MRVRHAITNTNYYVRIFSESGLEDRTLRDAVPLAEEALSWVRQRQLTDLPLTGLTRKVLQRMGVMRSPMSGGAAPQRLPGEPEDGLDGSPGEVL